MSPPAGTVTLLFTDVEGSTRLLERLGTEPYAEVLEQHRRLLRETFARHDGYEVDTEGDAFFVAFARADAAVASAAEAQLALAEAAWPEGVELRVRMGVHTGEPMLAGSDYVGIDVHQAARIMSVGHGGQVVISASTRALIDAELSELGEHRLKDFDEPVALFQLGDESFPPLKTISNTNLPRPASSFVGREREQGELVALLGNGSRLVTLSGPGGSGKTRLAIEVASELVPAFRAGVFWIGLATVRDPALVAPAIAQTLGAKGGLGEHVGDRELLLLLDNFEQVVEAAAELSQLLETCPNLKLLVTSRELLRINGEVDYPVPPLASAEAIVLFCERAHLAADDSIAELCRRLDDLPLALELAAARSGVLTPTQILDRLDKRLDLLKGGRDADPRQQTLRATIEWSHDLLDPDEQTLFRRLAVFRGGCTLDAAENVCDADLDTLQSLVDKSLLRQTDGRFWMLETIRAYAVERLVGSADESEMRRRHAAHGLRFAESVDPNKESSSDLPVVYSLVDAEYDNLRATLEWARDTGEGELLLRLTAALEYYWPARGLRQERDAWNALALERGSAPASARMTVLNFASGSAARQEDWARADALLTEWLRLAEEEGDEHEVLRAMNVAGIQATDKGDFDDARRRLTETARRAAEAGDGMILSFATVNLAGLCESTGEFEAGIEYAAEAARLFREGKDEVGESTALVLSAWCSLGLSDPARAAANFHGSLTVVARHGYFRSSSTFMELSGFATSLVGLDITEAAVELYGAAESLRQELDTGFQEEAEERMAAAAAAKAKAALGEESFVATWERGAAMTCEEAVAFALAVPLPADAGSVEA
jgi:predicted ATPase/class 3 adenylate cyclase